MRFAVKHMTCGVNLGVHRPLVALNGMVQSQDGILVVLTSGGGTSDLTGLTLGHKGTVFLSDWCATRI